MEAILTCLWVLAVGACIGSFLNVVALRALTGESIVFPASKCPKCSTPIKWYDNIPVFSYFFTFKGKCRNCKESVSKQYPIVEALTAIIFLVVFIAFGFTLKTLLLLILLSVSTVIAITDIKQECIFTYHAWILIITSVITSLYLNGMQNILFPLIGLVTGIIVMELVARLSYYLVRPDNVNDEEITEYVKNNKRTFGEGDTYIAAAAGALLGWKGALLTIALAVVLQALFILPDFLKKLCKQKQFVLLALLAVFCIITVIYEFLSYMPVNNLYLQLLFIAVLIINAVFIIKKLNQTVTTQGFNAVPFGPALLIAMVTILFYGKNIINLLPI